ncbi:hypothetical protein AB0L65_58245 [Nonomuraea sp. NPDC052116]|uniref:hypothetical protein n=1 Tax=Nonomuraea sp. NPDC052116 TaxID=3155665 RepID=UPI00342F6A8D
MTCCATLAAASYALCHGCVRGIRGGQPVGLLDEGVRVLAARATAARLKTAARTRGHRLMAA